MQEDPEIQDLIRKAQSGGMGSIMQLMQDNDLLAKVGAKMGDITPALGGGAGGVTNATAPPPAAAAAPAPTQPEVEINDLLDAAKCAPSTHHSCNHG